MQTIYMIRVAFEDGAVITHPASDENNAQRIANEASEVYETWKDIEVYSCEMDINLIEYLTIH